MKWKDRAKEAKMKRDIVMSRSFENEKPIYTPRKVESIEEFLKRGGRIKHLPNTRV